MLLYIDTTLNDKIKIALFSKKNNKYFLLSSKYIATKRQQSEKLLPVIINLLKKNNLEFKDLKMITVSNEGGSFTSLRIGVVTANALAYALGVKVRAAYLKNKEIIFKENGFTKINNHEIVEAIYNKEASIG